MYGETAHQRTMNNPRRDAFEKKEFGQAQHLGKKLVGICRGSQFLCVMAGGKLVQDQQIQPRYHPMSTHDGRIITVSSTHHQAQWPWCLPKKDFFVIGFTKRLSKWHHDANNDEMVDGASDATYGVSADGKEIEVCYYLRIKALCIQPHPEYYYESPNDNHLQSIAYFQDLLNRHMEDRL